jgi:hypothetical protein
MASFGFYLDSGLTQPITGNVSVSEGSSDFRFYLGSTSSAVKLQDATNPGVDDMYVSIVDSAPGSGPEVTWVKLALTQAGLATAIAGDPLSIGNTLYGGTSFSLPFWVRISNTLSGVASSTELSAKVTNVKEFSV